MGMFQTAFLFDELGGQVNKKIGFFKRLWQPGDGESMVITA